MWQDTIAAIATATGEAGIGIVRVSGPEARQVAARLFRRRGGGPILPRRLLLGTVHDPEGGELLDEALAALMPAPASYTREDVLELQCHGGALALRRILAACLAAGARLAQPGEFTLRAFLNGRLDLTQAEAVIDIVRSRSDRALSQAVAQLSGRLSIELQRLRANLLALQAHLTALVDFDEEDVPPFDYVAALETALADIDAVLAGARQGILQREGLRLAIVGRPNVGKSSLLNRLLREERAIVTPVAGTTRDTVEETIVIDGVPLLLVDTAGLRATDDEVERLGVERSQRAIGQADLVLLVADAAAGCTQADEVIAGEVQGKPGIVVVNKCDLVEVTPAEWLGLLPAAPVVAVSALSGTGVAQLEQQIVATALGGELAQAEQPLLNNSRHEQALRHARAAVDSALQAAEAGQPPDLLTIDLEVALRALGEVTGESYSEDLLDAIFSRFCIGK